MQIRLVLRPPIAALILGGIALYLACQSLIAEYLIEKVLDENTDEVIITVIDLWSVNAEQTIPTWYSILLLFTAAVILGLIAFAHVTSRERNTLYWAGLSVIFFYLSMDEGAVIHEIASDWVQANFEVSGFLTFGWQIVAAPLVILFGLVYLRFLMRLPARTRYQFILAAMVYIGGALFVESISANQYDIGGGVTFEYLAIATVEEFCEMLGVVIFIHALLVYAAHHEYRLLVEPLLTSGSAAVPMPARAGFGRRMALLVPVLIVACNAAMIYWALTQAPDDVSAPQVFETLDALQPSDTPEPSGPAYLSLTDHLTAEGLIVTRISGRFGPENAPALQMAATLLESFDEVMVITLISGDAADDFSLIATAERIPFNRSQLTTLLHEYDLTQFIIFDTPAVRVFTRAAQLTPDE